MRLPHKLIFALSFSGGFFLSHAQNNSVSIGTQETNSNAVLWLNSPDGNQGFILPSGDRTKVASPAKGMVIFDTNTNQIFFHDGTQWSTVGGAGGKTYTLTVNANNQLVLSDGTTSTPLNVPIAGDVTGATLGSTTVTALRGKLLPANFSAGALTSDANGNLSWTPAIGSGTVTSVTAGTGLTGGTITSSGTLAVDVGTTANKIVQLDGNGKLPALDGSQLTNLPSSSLTLTTTGTSGAATLVGNSLNIPQYQLTETDPTVKAISGIVKSNGSTISAAVSGTDYQPPLVSGTNIKTINSTSILGSGNLSVVTAESDPVVKAISGIIKSNGTLISAAVAGTDYLPASGGTGVTTLGTITSGTWNATKISEGFGGTNQTTYATGDLLYASAPNTLTKLPVGSTGQVLTVGGSGTPSWTTVSGTGTVTSITAGAGLTGGTITNAGTIAVDAGTGPGQIVQLDANGKLPAIDGSQLINLPAGGTVTSVTSTAPISVVTGTTTPVISIPQANGTTSGYLSSTDWSTFNSKQGSLTLTTTGTSGAATLIGNTLNIPQYAGTTYSAGTGLTLSGNSFSVNTSQNITTLSNLSSNGLIKTSGGTGLLSIATAGTDYAPPAPGSTILKANGSGGFASAVSGTDYLAPFGSQTAGTFYAAPGGSAGAPSFRAIVASDIPTLNQNTTGTAGSVANGLSVDNSSLQLSSGSTYNGSTALTMSVKNAGITNSMLAGSIAASKLVGTDINTVGTISSGVWNGAKITEGYGGTNQTTYAAGDILYASATNTLTKLGIGTSGQVLTVNGGVPTWQNASTGWGLTGNTGTNPATNFIGTNDAQDLVFKTNSSEKLRLVNSTGYVGIGTTAPAARLGIAGATTYDAAISLSNTGGGSDWRISSDTDGTLKFIKTSGTTFPPLTLNNSGAVGVYDGVGGVTFGTAGQVLTSGGSSAPPTWTTMTGAVSPANTIVKGNSAGTAQVASQIFDDGTSVALTASPTSGATKLTVQNEVSGGPNSVVTGTKALRVTAADNSASQVIALETRTIGSNAGQQIGIFNSVDGASTQNRGIVTSAQNSTNINSALEAYAQGNSGTNYGIQATVGGTQTNAKYGLSISMAGNGNKFGVYSTGEDYNYFSGSVGIGTSTPGAALEVAGQVKITGGSPGAGKILISDASGLASWGSASGITAGDGLTLSGSTLSLGGALSSIPRLTSASNTMMEMVSSGASQNTKAGFNFRMDAGYTGVQYELYANKSDATANSGNSDFILSKLFSTAGGQINALTIEGSTNNIIFNNSNSSASAYGDVIVANGNVAFGGVSNAAYKFLAYDASTNEAIAVDNNGVMIGDVAGNSYSNYFYTDFEASPRFIFMGANVGIGTTSPGAALDVQSGDINTNGEVHRTSTGAANMVPIAYGAVDQNGNILSGSGNFSVITTGTSGIHNITILGESYSNSGYITTATITQSGTGGQSHVIFTQANGTQLQIAVTDTSGGTPGGIWTGYHFVVYKP